MANFFDTVMAMGVDGITVSPGYAYERAPDQQHFLNRDKTKQLFRDIFRRGNGAQKWSFSQSSLFLDFLAGNQTYHCTPWGNPTRTDVRLAEALLPARRRLCQDLQGADGRDRLGRLRHRQLREMRRLHGALRLRGDRRAGRRHAIRSRRWRSACAASAPKARWRPTSRSIASGRRNTCSRSTSSRNWTKSARTSAKAELVGGRIDGLRRHRSGPSGTQRVARYLQHGMYRIGCGSGRRSAMRGRSIRSSLLSADCRRAVAAGRGERAVVAAGHARRDHAPVPRRCSAISAHFRAAAIGSRPRQPRNAPADAGSAAAALASSAASARRPGRAPMRTCSATHSGRTTMPSSCAAHGFDVIADTITGRFADAAPRRRAAPPPAPRPERRQRECRAPACDDNGRRARQLAGGRRSDRRSQLNNAQHDALDKLQTAVARIEPRPSRPAAAMPARCRADRPARARWCRRSGPCATPALTLRAPLKDFYEIADGCAEGELRMRKQPQDDLASQDAEGRKRRHGTAVSGLRRAERRRVGASDQADRTAKSGRTRSRRASLETLRKTSADMAKLLMASCAQPIPADPLARLDAANDQLTAMNYAATIGRRSRSTSFYAQARRRTEGAVRFARPLAPRHMPNGTCDVVCRSPSGCGSAPAPRAERYFR